jgi:hypothetical protein
MAINMTLMYDIFVKLQLCCHPVAVVQHTFTHKQDGFGGLVVNMLASGTQGRGLKPGRSRWIFTDVKILTMPSSGGEVKESVPCLSFASC